MAPTGVPEPESLQPARRVEARAAPVRQIRLPGARLGWLGLSEAKPQGAMNHLWGRPPAADSTTATQMRAQPAQTKP